MILTLLSVVATLFSAAFYILSEVPTLLRWISLIIGGLIILSRTLAWQSGAAQGARDYLESIAEDDTQATSMLTYNTNIELIYWTLALVNIFFFFQ